MTDAQKLKDAIAERTKAVKAIDDKLSKIADHDRIDRQEQAARSNHPA